MTSYSNPVLILETVEPETKNESVYEQKIEEYKLNTGSIE